MTKSNIRKKVFILASDSRGTRLHHGREVGKQDKKLRDGVFEHTQSREKPAGGGGVGGGVRRG